jgi:hypothetical protein|uniref:Uncharacterized protein n=1 Tax=viral metagenome TaxID=1070528 RepID=A0A6C0C2N8_9ZZZZ
MGLLEGINTAWIPYYYRVKKIYEKKKHLDRNKKIFNELKRIHTFAVFAPLYTTYNDLDKIKIKLESIA